MRRALVEVQREQTAGKGQLDLLAAVRTEAPAPETADPTCIECGEPLVPPFVCCEACGQDAPSKAQDAPAEAPEEGLDLAPRISQPNEEKAGALTPESRASLTIAKCLVNAAGLTGAFNILIPYAGENRVLLEQAREVPGTFANIERCVVAEHFLAMLPSVKAFDRVILWSDEWDLQTEREHFLHGFELLKPGGKIVAAISTDLASDRSFRIWATKKSATFEETGTSFRSRGLTMVTLWKQS